jgi:hypothetical protein
MNFCCIKSFFKQENQRLWAGFYDTAINTISGHKKTQELVLESFEEMDDITLIEKVI